MSTKTICDCCKKKEGEHIYELISVKMNGRDFTVNVGVEHMHLRRKGKTTGHRGNFGSSDLCDDCKKKILTVALKKYLKEPTHAP